VRSPQYARTSKQWIVWPWWFGFENVCAIGQPFYPFGRHSTITIRLRHGNPDTSATPLIRTIRNPNTVPANTARELQRKNAWAAAHIDKEVFLWSQVCYSPSKFMRSGTNITMQIDPPPPK
jgi:hypothetical protein